MLAWGIQFHPKTNLEIKNRFGADAKGYKSLFRILVPILLTARGEVVSWSIVATH